MKIIITETAQQGQFDIYQYYKDYSVSYAEKTYFDLDKFIRQNLSEHPRMGHLYNESKSLYRLIYQKRYNIYYVIRADQIFVLYIIDGRIEMNMLLADPDVELPQIDE